MQSIELILELPAEESNESDFPGEGDLPRGGPVARATGLNGEQFLQLSAIVTAGSVRVLRTWLLSRAERLKHTRVRWNGVVLEGYTDEEVEQIVRLLRRELGDAEEENR